MFLLVALARCFQSSVVTAQTQLPLFSYVQVRKIEASTSLTLVTVTL